MLRITTEQPSGDTPTQLLVDAGYWSVENLTAIADTTFDAGISHSPRPRRSVERSNDVRHS